MIIFDFMFVNHTTPTVLDCFLLLIFVKSEILATILRTVWTWKKKKSLHSLRMLFSTLNESFILLHWSCFPRLGKFSICVP